MSITMIGLDTAKSVFQIHGVNETGKVLDFPPRSGGLRSERHAAMPMLTLAISSRACAGVR